MKFDIYSVSTEINYFYVVPYTGSSYKECDSSYSAIKVEINLESITSRTTVIDFINLVDAAVVNNPFFDNRFTSCKMIDLSENQYGFGNSYTLLKCKLNDNYAPIVPNLKLAAVFPSDANSMFYSTPSACAFLTDISDNSGNIICEFNQLVAESPILQSSFDSSNAYIRFKCKDYEYDNSYNNFNISIPSSGKYTLSGFINAFNSAALTQLPTFYNTNTQFINKIPNGIFITMIQDTDGYININSNFSMVYNNSSYQAYVNTSGPTSYLINFFGFSTTPTDIPFPPNYTNPDNLAGSLTFTYAERLYIIPKRNSNIGNKNAEAFEILFDASSTVYGDIYEFQAYVYKQIISYVDPITQTRPLSGSNVIVNSGNQMTLNLNISYTITPSHYSITLEASSNIWKDLSFNSSPFVYDLLEYSNNNYTIKSNGVIRNNEFIIKNGVNDTFYINPSTIIDVFNTSGNTYSVPINIPDNSINGSGTPYIITDLIAIINSKFSENPITNGSNISLNTSQNGQSFVKFKFNCNVAFTTKDFNLVFYDPFSFAKCISHRNASSSSLQNATWDATLGWLLGYRTEIAYSLSDYLEMNYPNGTMFPNNYYLSDNSNVCVLIGDTNVSTNLYNYFLIMLDDYVQNHLNDGLVTITNQEKIVNPGPHIYICDPVTLKQIAVPADYGSRVLLIRHSNFMHLINKFNRSPPC